METVDSLSRARDGIPSRDIKNEAVDEKPVLEPNAVERYQINEIMKTYENIDYLMALVLVKSTETERAAAMKLEKKTEYKPMTTEIIKNNISII